VGKSRVEKFRQAVFLDRDGTINHDCGYLHRVEDFAFLPGAAGAIERLRSAGFLIVVVTNQSGIARGLYGAEELGRLHRYILDQLARAETAIDAFYFCPHHPEVGQGGLRTKCSCRKGEAGLLVQAAAELDIDLKNSYMVGDKASDVEAGRRAGCKPILVLTGCGAREAGSVGPDVPRLAGLGAAADYILERERNRAEKGKNTLPLALPSGKDD